MEVEPEQVVCHYAHLLVSLHVVYVDGVHVVKGLVEGFRDFDL